MKFYHNIIFIIIVEFLLSAPVDIDLARTVAENFYNMVETKNKAGKLIIRSHKLIEHDSEGVIYLFHLEPDGFILMSADDRSNPILAYSFENPFVINGMPSNVAWIIHQYKENIIKRTYSNQFATEETRQRWDTYRSGHALKRQQSRSVKPLITAKFDQDGDWNNKCPQPINGGCGINEQVKVGCVAVAMSQIMHYWRYPIQGDSLFSYTSFGQQFINFSNSFYDYEAMGEGVEATNAAAELLYETGVSVAMNYGCDESGSQVSGNPSAEHAFKTYFQFRSDLSSKDKSSFSENEFIDRLKEELDYHRPFIFSGYGDDFLDGHAWVCDGYDEYDRFNMNWGWGGKDNGYFTVDNLSPSPYDFNTNSRVLIGIEPPDGAIVSPRIILKSYNTYEIFGDKDEVINPGEIVDLEIEILNSPSWHDASSFELELITDEAGLSISKTTSFYMSINELSAGQVFTNSDAPFTLSIDPNIEFGDKILTIKVNAFGLVGQPDNSFLHEYKIPINVSLNQFGFPVSTVKINPSPLIIDMDDDGQNEIIIGDETGIIHIYNADGTELIDDVFPFDTDISYQGGKIWGSAAAADLDNDGLIEFVVVSSKNHDTKEAYLHIFDKNGLQTKYVADTDLRGTPAIGNLDDDDELEIVFTGYSSDNKVFVINSDGSDVSGFPFELGEKVKAGVALADFNNNGKDDIVLGTDSSRVHLIYDDGSEAPGFPFQLGDTTQTAPSILDVNGDKLIFAGTGYNLGQGTDHKLYAINSDGTLRFAIEANRDIITSPSFLSHNGKQYIFFGTYDSLIYAVDTDGEAPSGWPKEANGKIVGSIVFSDLDCDGEVEIIAANESHIVAYNFDGTSHSGFPIKGSTAFTGAPIVFDLDNDGDLEILSGEASHLTGIDIKSVFSYTSYWNMYRGNLKRTGYSGTSPIGGDNTVCSVLSNNIKPYLPSGYKLNPLYPNPFNPTTTISYSIPNSAHVMIWAYDIRGRLIDNIISSFQSPGYHSINWDATTYPSGVYFLSMKAGSFRKTRKVLLIK